MRTVFSIVVVFAIGTLAGCTHSQDVSLRSDIRAAGIINKTYQTSEPFYISTFLNHRSICTDLDFKVDSPVEIPPGTVVRVTGVRRFWSIKTTSYRPVVEIGSESFVVERGVLYLSKLPIGTWIQGFRPVEDLSSIDSERLVSLLANQEWQTRFAAADALRRTQPHTQSINERILLALHHENDHDVRIRLLHALDDAVAQHYPYDLVAMLQREMVTRFEIQRVRSLLSSVGEAVLPALRLALRQVSEKDRFVVRRIERVLRDIGPEANSLLPALEGARHRQGRNTNVTPMWMLNQKE